MHSRKSIFKRGIAFVLAFFAMVIFTQVKVGAACEVFLQDGAQYLTLGGSNSKWRDSGLDASAECNAPNAVVPATVFVNGKQVDSFTPQNGYTEGQYTIEYKYSFGEYSGSVYRYVRILNANFDTSKNYTLGSFDVFNVDGEGNSDTQIVNAFYDSANGKVINFVVSNGRTHVVFTNLLGKEYKSARKEISYLYSQSYALSTVNVISNNGYYYLIGNTTQGGVIKKISVDNLEITEYGGVNLHNATSVYSSAFVAEGEKIYLVGSNDGYPVIDLFSSGVITTYYKYTDSKGSYSDVLVKYDHVYVVGYTTVSASITKPLYTYVSLTSQEATTPLVLEEEGKFTKIVSSDSEYNIVIGESYALQISAGGSISAINTRAGYSDALVLEVSNEGKAKRNAGLYGGSLNDVFTNIILQEEGVYSLVGLGNDNTTTLVYTLKTSDFSITEEITSRKSNLVVNGTLSLPYGLSYYGKILNNKDLVLDIYYPRAVTVSDPLLLLLDNRVINNEQSSQLTDETINLVQKVNPTEEYYKYCYYTVKFSNADHNSIACVTELENPFIPSDNVTTQGIAALLEYHIDTGDGGKIVIYRTVMITGAPTPVDLSSGMTGILKWYTYNRSYTNVNSTAIRLDPTKTSYYIAQGNITVNYTANYDYYFTGSAYASMTIYDMISHYFATGSTTGFTLDHPSASNVNKKVYMYNGQTSAAFASIEYAKKYAYYQEFSRVIYVPNKILKIIVK